MTPPRIGSLCSGYGGLDLGLMAVVGGSVAWHVEYDKHPSAVLDARFPGVPNYGDVTTTDWAQVEPVDWLTAGYPCQPFSHAGKRKGSADERHLWPDIARAIGILRPRNVLLENVRGHVSLGLDAVLADIAALGYDTQWGVVSASKAGAPHERARVFIAATDARSQRHGGGQDGRSLGRVDGQDAGEARQRERTRPVAGDRGIAAVPDPAGDGWHEGRPEPARQLWRPDAAVGGHALPDSERGRRDGRAPDTVGHPLQRATAAGGCESACCVGADWRTADGDDYGPAVRRWHNLTRCVPCPTEIGPKGGRRLSPLFDEWMMGLPAGWVTDVLPRNPALKALGNGVVPQQAALAVRTLLGVEAVAA